MSKTLVYILAGGSGTRLSPLSLTSEGKLPKQYLSIVGEKTMLQETIHRVPEGIDKIVVAEKKYEDDAKKQIGDQAGIILEPFGCNTAIAVGLSAIHAKKKTGDENTVLFIKAADHHMNSDYFQRYFHIASEEAKKGKIITIGITPDRPETGYGYIKTKDCLVDKYKDGHICEVECFVEKPDLEKATQYVQSGDFYWNSGMFVFTIKTIMDSIEKHSPKIFEALKEIEKDLGTDKELESITKHYQKIKDEKENISIDYAVMEKEAENILLVKAKPELEWNDIGGWNAIERYCEIDGKNSKKGNTKICNCEKSLAINYLKKSKLKLIVDGLDDHLTIATDNGILVSPRSSAQKAKECVKALEENQLEIIINSNNVSIKNQKDIPVAFIDCENIEVEFLEEDVTVKKV